MKVTFFLTASSLLLSSATLQAASEQPNDLGALVGPDKAQINRHLPHLFHHNKNPDKEEVKVTQEQIQKKHPVKDAVVAAEHILGNGIKAVGHTIHNVFDHTKDNIASGKTEQRLDGFIHLEETAIHAITKASPFIGNHLSNNPAAQQEFNTLMGLLERFAGTLPIQENVIDHVSQILQKKILKHEALQAPQNDNKG